MELRQALERLAVLENSKRGWDFHYTSCGIYHQGLFTIPKSKDDPTRKCDCGRDEAIAVVINSSVGRHIAAEVARQLEVAMEDVVTKKSR